MTAAPKSTDDLADYESRLMILDDKVVVAVEFGKVVALLDAERQAREEAEKWAATYRSERDQIGESLSALRDEIAAMRPVIDAADHWANDVDTDPAVKHRLDENLLDAIEAFLDSRRPEGVGEPEGTHRGAGGEGR
jgi:hypothetical protein